jgi:hypothetical protein
MGKEKLKSKIMNKRKELGVFVCEHVIAKKRPIKMIVHNHDKTWECMCGEIDHHDFIDSKVIGLNNLIKFDQTILPVKKLPVGCIAEREKVNGEWVYSEIAE